MHAWTRIVWVLVAWLGLGFGAGRGLRDFGLPAAGAGLPPPGSVDPSFAARVELTAAGGTRQSGDVRAVAIQADGRIVAGGRFDWANGVSVTNLARFHPDGRYDSSFVGGTDPLGVVNAVVVRPDGLIWVGGSFKRVGGERRVGLARLRSDGSLDPSFELIPEMTGEVLALVRSSDDGVLVGGRYECLDPLRARMLRHLARWLPRGGWDPEFAPEIPRAPAGFPEVTQVTGLLLQQGGRMLTTLRPPLAPDGNSALWAMTSTGARDAAYPDYFRMSERSLIACAVAHDRVLVSHGWSGAGAFPVIARYLPDGNSDPTFGFVQGLVFAAAANPDETVVVAGELMLAGLPAGISISRLRPDGAWDATYGLGGGLDVEGLPRVLAWLPEGGTLVGGRFEKIGGVVCRGLCRLSGGEAQGPVIVEPPRNQTVPTGSDVEFRVTASGSEPLRYQWRNLGRDLPGETNATLRIPAVRSTEAHAYSVRVANVAGMATSSVARLNLQTPPTIVMPPESWVFRPGVTFQFSVIASGTAPLSYQWLKDGLPIFAATNDVLERGPIALADVGEYRVLVAGPGGSVTSSPAFLRLRSAQAGDVDPSFAPGNGVAGRVETILPLRDGRVGVGGWFTNVAGIPHEGVAVLQTNGMPDPAFVARVPRALRVAAVGEQRDGSLVVGGRIDSATGTEGYVARLGSDGSVLAELRFPAVIADLAVQSDDRVWVSGGFRWVASATHVYTNLTRLLPDLGWDRSFPTNAPPNGYVARMRLDPQGRLMLAGSFSEIQGRRRTSVARLLADGWLDLSFAPGEIRNGQGAAQLWALANTPEGSWYLGGNFDSVDGVTVRGVARFSGAGKLEPAFGFMLAGTVNEELRAITVQSNGWVVLGGRIDREHTGGISAHVLRLTPEGVLDRSFAAAIGLSPSVACLAVQPDQKLLIGGELVAENPASQRGIVRTLVGDPVAPYFFKQPEDTVLPPGAGVVLFGEAAGARALDYHWEKDGRAVPGAELAPLILRQVTFAEAGDYVLWASNRFGMEHSRTARVEVMEPPVIVAAPASLTAVAGETVTLQATVTGGEPLHCEWTRDSARLRGATDTTLVLSAVGTNDNGAYVLTVTNRLSKVTSQAARLTVVVPPRIRRGPTDQRVHSGSTVTLAVEAEGSLPMGYQWWKDGRRIEGQTTSAWAAGSVRPNDAGVFTLVITNAYGGCTSGPVHLEVLVPPLIVEGPKDSAVMTGAPARFTVVTTGSEPLFYQWLFEGAEIPGANSPTLEIGSAQPTSVGAYQVVVGSPAGLTASLQAHLKLIVDAPPLSAMTLGFEADASFRLEAEARDGQYRIESSGDLTTWSVVWSGRVTEGRLRFVDSSPAGVAHRFYRVIWSESSR